MFSYFYLRLALASHCSNELWFLITRLTISICVQYLLHECEIYFQLYFKNLKENKSVFTYFYISLKFLTNVLWPLLTVKITSLFTSLFIFQLLKKWNKNSARNLLPFHIQILFRRWRYLPHFLVCWDKPLPWLQYSLRWYWNWYLKL